MNKLIGSLNVLTGKFTPVTEYCWYCKKPHEPKEWCVEKWDALHRMMESLKTGRKPKGKRRGNPPA